MQCRSAKPEMAGPAFTVRVHTADILMVAAGAFAMPQGPRARHRRPGRVEHGALGRVDDVGSAAQRAWPELLSTVRFATAATISRSRFPVFARAVVPNAGGAEYVGELNVTVQCGGQVVRPGDWMVGDEDGVVVIPAERLPDAIGTAERIVAAEKEHSNEPFVRGADLGELLRCQEVIERKRSEVFLPQLRAVPPKRRP